MVTFDIVSGWALTHVENHNPAFFLTLHALKNLSSSFSLKNVSSFILKFLSARQFFCPDNSNMFHMFTDNIYTNFRTA